MLNVESDADMVKLCARAVEWYFLQKQRGINSANAADLDQFRRLVRGHWHSFAQITAWDLRAHGARVDANHVGYVILRQRGLDAFVPFYMRDMIPLGGTLADIVELAAEVQIGTSSVVCLSGSTCQIGAEAHVADVDFCEYVPDLDEKSKARLDVWANRSDEQGPRFVKLTLGSGEPWVAPWNDTLNNPKLPAEAIIEKIRAANFRQLTFVGETPALGMLEITNLILDVDFSLPEGAVEAQRSFAFQEVPLSTSGWTPRDLSDPIRLGGYLVWLVNNAGEQAEASRRVPRKVVKSLRRLISVCRMLMLGKELDGMLRLLNSEGALLAALVDRSSLYAQLPSRDDAFIEKAKTGLLVTINAIREKLGFELVDSSIGSVIRPGERNRFEQFSTTARAEILPVIRTVRSYLKLA